MSGSRQESLHQLVVVKAIGLSEVKDQLNKVDENGNTPLHVLLQAYSSGKVSPDNFKNNFLVLINSEADVIIANKQDQTPLELMINLLNVKHHQIIREHLDLNYSPIERAILTGDLRDFAQLVIKESKENTSILEQPLRNLNGNSLLMLAISLKKNDIAKYLLESKNISPNVLFKKNEAGLTAIHAAIQTNNEEVIQLILKPERTHLLEEKINNENFFHFAAHFDHEAVMSVMLSYSFIEEKLTEKNREGKTPLEIALDQGNLHVAYLMLQKLVEKKDINDKVNAYLNNNNIDLKKFYEQAVKAGMRDCVNFLDTHFKDKRPDNHEELKNQLDFYANKAKAVSMIEAQINQMHKAGSKDTWLRYSNEDKIKALAAINNGIKMLEPENNLTFAQKLEAYLQGDSTKHVNTLETSRTKSAPIRFFSQMVGRQVSSAKFLQDLKNEFINKKPTVANKR